MIENVADLGPLVETGDAEALSLPVDIVIGKDTLTAAYDALRVRRGSLLIWNEAAVPVVGGRTSTARFMDLQLQKFPGLLERSLQPTANLSRALFVGGNGNYYHFLANYFPMFAFLTQVRGERCTVAMRNGMPESVKNIVEDLLASIAGRPVDVVTLDAGVYALDDVVFPTVAATELACAAVRRWLIPFVLRKQGQRETGALKIFIRREGSATGRNLVNQPEVEAWFTARGYMPVNPGALPFEEQIMLFTRASHVAGVEGAAFANLLFAINAREILMIASPALRGERSMAKLVRRTPVMFRTLYGHQVSEQPGRNGDYHLPLATLETYQHYRT